jgi:hypothetical protein
MQEHVVLLIHGIRTRARWVGMVADMLERHSPATSSPSVSLKVEPVDYGRFSLWRFILPGPTRWSAVAIVGNRLQEVRERGDDLTKPEHERRLISVIAHSFGSYCLFRALDKQPHVKLHRVILCGSILPKHFNFDRYEGRLGADQVLNECGDMDPWPVLAKKVAWGCGSAGTFGLSSGRAINRFHPQGHSDYFDAGFVLDMWKPFLERGEVKRSDWDKRRYKNPAPRWISVLDWFPLMPAILAALYIFMLIRH